MTKEREKIEVFEKFKKLENFLRSSLGGKNRKLKIIRRVEKEAQKSGEKEGVFIKLFLACILFDYFQDSSIEVIIEGVNSEGRTQFSDNFFDSKPATDFLFEKRGRGLFPPHHIIPLPLDTVGEIKYGNLNFRSFATGLGQIIGYLNANKKFNYGYYIFFNTDVNKTVTDRDREFLDGLWKKENIFVVII